MQIRAETSHAAMRHRNQRKERGRPFAGYALRRDAMPSQLWRSSFSISARLHVACPLFSHSAFNVHERTSAKHRLAAAHTPSGVGTV